MSLALELEKKNIECLLIEAGGEFYNENSDLFYKVSSDGSNLKDINISRLRQFGGTSASWGGWCKPFSNLDFKKTGFDPNLISKYQSRACDILKIENSFRETPINEDFNQIEFQYSDVRFHEKYFNHIKLSKKFFYY